MDSVRALGVLGALVEASFHSRKLKKGVRVKSEHKRCSGALLEALFSKWNTKGVLLKGILGVRVCSGCSGCPGEKTKRQKASFHNRKLKRVFGSNRITKGVQVPC